MSELIATDKSLEEAQRPEGAPDRSETLCGKE